MASESTAFILTGEGGRPDAICPALNVGATPSKGR